MQKESPGSFIIDVWGLGVSSAVNPRNSFPFKIFLSYVDYRKGVSLKWKRIVW